MEQTSTQPLIARLRRGSANPREFDSPANEVVWPDVRTVRRAGGPGDTRAGTAEQGRQYILIDAAEQTDTGFETLAAPQEPTTDAIDPTPLSYSRRNCKHCGGTLRRSKPSWGRTWTCSGCRRRSF